jgi:hypothetical protein
MKFLDLSKYQAATDILALIKLFTIFILLLRKIICDVSKYGKSLCFAYAIKSNESFYIYAKHRCTST